MVWEEPRSQVLRPVKEGTLGPGWGSGSLGPSHRTLTGSRLNGLPKDVTPTLRKAHAEREFTVEHYRSGRRSKGSLRGTLRTTEVRRGPGSDRSLLEPGPEEG